MYKGLMIILDGLGDRPNSSLAKRTPLQAAVTPQMDRLLAAGSCGQIDTLSPGVPVGTHTGTSALMGIDRNHQLLLDRGPVEAAGVNVKTKKGDILFRVNFATVDEDGVSLIDRRAGRIDQGTGELADCLKNIKLKHGIKASLYPATQHRAVLRLRGKDLSPHVSNTDPCRMYPDAKCLKSHALDPDDKKAKKTAKALNQFLQIAAKILADHPVNKSLELPANALLTRGAGFAFIPENLLTRQQIVTAVVSGDRTIHGLAKLFGFNVISSPEFTASFDTNLSEKFSAAVKALEKHDMVYLHIKATDIYSHNKDATGKRLYLEAIDKHLECLHDMNLVIGITGDHSTDSISGNHNGDPVPSLITAPSCRIDSVTEFSELNCTQGGLGRIRGRDFLYSMLDLMGRLNNYCPQDIDFID